MFGSISGAEILVVLTLALLLFGPRSLPKIGQTLGKTLAELRRASRDFKSGLEREVELDRVKEVKDELVDAGREIAQAVKNPAAGSTGDSSPDPGAVPDAAKSREDS